jgi:hypothetical protein
VNREKERIMNTITTFLANLLTRRTNAMAARGLFERATTARGQSVFEMAQLRGNAMAMLSVVR